MSTLAAAYVEELAEGRIPSPDSPEALAYQEWSRDYESRRKSALRKLLVIQIVAASVTAVYGTGFVNG